MANTLPDDASLEWLKKNAKQRKAARAFDDPDVTLAQVQYALAQEVGFSSWRALKAYFDQKDVTGSDADGVPEFFRAVSNGDVAAFDLALAQDPALANVLGTHPFFSGRLQALHLAVEARRADLVSVLLDAGADPNGRNAEYDFWSPLMLALRDGADNLVALLKAAGAVMGPCEALMSGDDTVVDRLFPRDVKAAEFPRPSGSLLAFARTPFAVRRLAALGFDAQSLDRWGSNAMDALSRLGAKGAPLVAALQAFGEEARPRDIARSGDLDALRTVCDADPAITLASDVFMAAVDFGHLRTVEWLLSQGADVQARHDFGSEGTALHSATWNGDVKMVTLLLENGADVSALDHEHRTTPIVWAKTARRITNNPDCDQVATLLEGWEPG